MSSSGMHTAPGRGAAHPSSEIAGVAPRTKLWRVIHACEYARDVLPVVEGQIAAGMRPYIVTPQGAGSAELYLSGKRQEQPRSLSLLRSWQDVRNWRKSILECEPETSADVVHAHSFAAGMAGVRSVSCVVYDPQACIEELAISAHLCDSGSWMARSFRVAEQFVISRAAAVVVHSQGMKQAVEERGAAPGNVFLVPDPLPFEEEELPPIPIPLGAEFLQQRLGTKPGEVVLFAPETFCRSDGGLCAHGTALLQAFALAAAEVPELKLVVLAPEELRPLVSEAARGLDISDRLRIAGQQDGAAFMRAAHAVIVSGETPQDQVQARQPNELCLQALYHGRALLAADIPRHRDASPDGRGCLWFEAANAGDLAHRIAFLGRHPEFREALGSAGQEFILKNRNFAVIGEKYKEVYRHAAARKRTTGTGQGMTLLEPAANWG